ncbi:helix-turn-helix domain-containing protein [Clostridium sp. Marseille-P2415]|uniref:helix-turn-helix domain-containing protein n=1 Tax=Clostridium sp. Marseille-P2415 TaxID=1805471 RepID=UPI0009883976|nr:helix-turn-helix transcriptional regulator [Clostridium sp. Marseille-P2415]
MDENYIPERLAQLRTQKGLSARDMSLSMGQADNYINNIENRKSMPSMQNFLSICEFLNVTPREFFDEDNSNPVLLNELISELKPLNGKALENLLSLLLDLQGKIKNG